jgi:hypothetical protein
MLVQSRSLDWSLSRVSFYAQNQVGLYLNRIESVELVDDRQARGAS